MNHIEYSASRHAFERRYLHKWRAIWMDLSRLRASEKKTGVIAVSLRLQVFFKHMFDLNFDSLDGGERN